MKHFFIMLAGGCWAMLLIGESLAAQPTVQWVEDSGVSSQSLLTAGQASRRLPMPGQASVTLIRAVLARDLHLQVAAYDQAHNQQEARTTLETSLPQPFSGPELADPAGTHYFFRLEVRVKNIAQQTQIAVSARPVYRIASGETKQPGSTGYASRQTEVMVKVGGTDVMDLGPILVLPAASQTLDFKTQTLPDGANRAAMLVRAFLAALDQRTDAWLAKGLR